MKKNDSLGGNTSFVTDHPTTWLWIIAFCLLSSWIQIRLGVNVVLMEIQLLLEVVFLMACIDFVAKRFRISIVLAYMICSFFSSGGIEYVDQLRLISPPAIREPAPSDFINIDEKDEPSIWDFFSSQDAREVIHPNYALPLGRSYYPLTFGERNRFYCRKFTLEKPSTVTLAISKADRKWVEFCDNEDWFVSLVKDEMVLHSDTVNRMDGVKVLSYRLAAGKYVLTIMRTKGNTGIRRINVGTSVK